MKLRFLEGCRVLQCLSRITVFGLSSGRLTAVNSGPAVNWVRLVFQVDFPALLFLPEVCKWSALTVADLQEDKLPLDLFFQLLDLLDILNILGIRSLWQRLLLHGYIFAAEPI